MSPDEGKPMAQAVKNSSTDPIIGSYDILAIKKRWWKKETAYVIDMTPTFEVMYKLFIGSNENNL
jgi:hypothetical protein